MMESKGSHSYFYGLDHWYVLSKRMGVWLQMLRKGRKGMDHVLQGVQPEMSIKIQFWVQNLLLNKVFWVLQSNVRFWLETYNFNQIAAAQFPCKILD